MNERKPFIVEFTGSPEAGKTTVIHILQNRLLKMGYTVKVFPESAENCPKSFPKNSLEAKLWINLDTLTHIVQAPFLSEYDIILFDRGAMDGLFWINIDARYHPNVFLKTASFEELFKSYPPNLLIALYVSEDESINRRGGEGKIVTKSFVEHYNSLFKLFFNSLQCNSFLICTDNLNIEEVVETAQKSILENMENHS